MNGLLLKNNCKNNSLKDLSQKLASYLPVDVSAYSIRHLKRRLLDHFKSDITIIEVEGKSDDVTMSQTETNILHESFVSANTTNVDDENRVLTKEVGSLIKDDLITVEQPSDVYTLRQMM